MIVLHSKQIVLPRVPKTGSTSIEVAVRMAGCLDPATDVASELVEYGFPGINLNADYVDAVATLRKAVKLRTRTPPSEMSEADRQVVAQAYDLSNPSPNVRVGPNLENLPLGHACLNTTVAKYPWALTEQQVMDYTIYVPVRHPLKRAISAFMFIGPRIKRSLRAMEAFHSTVLNGDLRSLVYRPQSDYLNYSGQRVATPVYHENFADTLDFLITQCGGTPLAEYPKMANSEIFIDPNRDPPTVENWIDPYPEVKAVLMERYADDIALWNEVTGQTIE